MYNSGKRERKDLKSVYDGDSLLLKGLPPPDSKREGKRNKKYQEEKEGTNIFFEENPNLRKFFENPDNRREFKNFIDNPEVVLPPKPRSKIYVVDKLPNSLIRKPDGEGKKRTKRRRKKGDMRPLLSRRKETRRRRRRRR